MGGLGGTVIYIVLMIVFFYFVLIRPQKKREKQTRMMLNDMRPGDEVITIGGVMGNIVSIKEDRVIIETGANRTKLTFEKGAIKTVLTVHEDEDEYELEDEE
ncbi:MAG: preprotein translocase subunit YajC [Clostridia bacterium]|nr:preprotein translocase subunit YajC [Clostridia bacterium]